MALTDYTFRLGDAGVVLNANSNSLPFVDIIEVRGLDSAPFRETTRDHEGVDGGFMDAEFEKARSITLSGIVYANANSMETYLDTLKANYAPSRTLVPFYFSAEGSNERVLFVKPQGVRYDWDLDRRLGVARVQFNMYAEDPRIYATSEQSTNIELGSITTDGFGFPMSMPLGFGATVEVGSSKTVLNAGNRPTPAEFTIFGPVTDPKIINLTSSKTLDFRIVLSASETLVINSYYRTVRLNGTNNRRNALLTPDWFDLDPGETTFKYEAGARNTTLFNPTPINANPYFESNTSSWSSQSSTIAWSTTRAHQGIGSMLITPDGVASSGGALAERISVRPTQQYQVSLWAWATSSMQVGPAVDWWTATSGGSFISTSFVGPTTVSAGVWTQVSGIVTAPATAVAGQLRARHAGTPTAGMTWWTDEAMIQGLYETSMNVKFRSAWR